MKSQNGIAVSNAILGRAVKVSLALCLAGCTFVSTGTARAQQLTGAVASAENDVSATYLSADELDNILAPIALYPDPLLAQVLVATTFSDQIDSAAQFVSANNDTNAIDYQPWDLSVKAVAHYPKVLLMVAEQPDWSASVGEAYVVQSTDVITSIQRLRALALAQGNLLTTTQQRVIAQGGIIQILPAQPNFLFVPVYNPALVFARPAVITFGPRLVVHESLVRHIDWRSHRIYDIHHRYGRIPVGRVRRDRVRGPERLRTRERIREPKRVGSPVRQPTPNTRPRCDTPGVGGCPNFGTPNNRRQVPTNTTRRCDTPGVAGCPAFGPTKPTTPTKTRGTKPGAPTTPTTPTKTRGTAPGTPTTPTKTRGTAPGMPNTPNTPTKTRGTAPSAPTTPNKTRGTAPAPTAPNKTRGNVQGAPATNHTMAGGATMHAPNMGSMGRGRRR